MATTTATITNTHTHIPCQARSEPSPNAHGFAAAAAAAAALPPMFMAPALLAFNSCHVATDRLAGFCFDHSFMYANDTHTHTHIQATRLFIPSAHRPCDG